MKLTRLLTCLFLSIMGMSCIQDEAPNAEADILTCTVPADILRRDPIITNDSANRSITLSSRKTDNGRNAMR